MLPLAFTETVWAALGGAVLGAAASAVATLGITALLEERREKNRRESLSAAGALLICEDLKIAAVYIQDFRRDKKWFSYAQWSDSTWRDYRGVLAEELERDAFYRLAGGVRAARGVIVAIPQVPSFPRDKGWMQLTDRQVRTFGVVVDEILDAYNAVAPLAGRRQMTADDLQPIPTIEELEGRG